MLTRHDAIMHDRSGSAADLAGRHGSAVGGSLAAPVAGGSTAWLAVTAVRTAFAAALTLKPVEIA
ncbi:Uncharacterised protein [Amycolatopsis camponoti]|uniref:Uncharacterized protein n=1 Tax=Amycolatopsis camponoti TaxID=2606593 RepID=A0A6I8M037_9PSEU|nr:Uncharacterised protein [Amycolatopsis camponoti]